MGYQMEYHLMQIKKKKLKKELPIWAKASLLALCAVMGHCLFVLLQIVLGGQWQQTLAASECMAEALQCGKTIPEAVQVFCAELVS